MTLDEIAAEPPEPGANPLDMAVLREAVAEVVQNEADPAWADTSKVAASILAVLAPHVAAAQRAAFRAGVDAAAECCDCYDPDDDEKAWVAAATLGSEIRRLSPPAAFAAPEPDTRAALVVALRALAADPATAGLCASDLAAEVARAHTP